MAFEIHPLGVRGSFPGSATRPSRFGQDTTCFFLRVGDQGLILDAGSGLTRLGPALLDQVKADSLALLLTHYHLDHLLGFPFFRSPSAQPLPVHGPILEGRGPEEALRHLMAPPLIPVGLEAVGAFAFHPFPAGTGFSVGQIIVESLAVPHPGGSIAYKLTGRGRALAFIPDIEHPGPDDAPDEALVDFVLDGLQIGLAVGAVLCLNRQLTNPLKVIRNFIHGTFSRLGEGNTIIGIPLCLIQARDL